jgi:hypothetical protein
MSGLSGSSPTFSARSAVEIASFARPAFIFMSREGSG